MNNEEFLRAKLFIEGKIIASKELKDSKLNRIELAEILSRCENDIEVIFPHVNVHLEAQSDTEFEFAGYIIEVFSEESGSYDPPLYTDNVIMDFGSTGVNVVG